MLNQKIPMALSRWVHDTVKELMPQVKSVFDPFIEQDEGRLLIPWMNDDVVRIGCSNTAWSPPRTDIELKCVSGPFVEWEKEKYPAPDIIITRMPYSKDGYSKALYGVSHIPEKGLSKCFSLFGKEVPIVAIVPTTLRYNTRCCTSRNREGRYRLMRDSWGEITASVSLPLDILLNNKYDKDLPIKRKKRAGEVSNLPRIEVQQEILFFNIPTQRAHAFLPEKVLLDILAEEKGMN